MFLVSSGISWVLICLQIYEVIDLPKWLVVTSPFWMALIAGIIDGILYD